MDENDGVLPALREVLDLIAEGDMLLSLCHQSVKERFIMIDEARKAGVKRIEAGHPLHLTAKMTADQMKTAAEKGAYLGMYCANLETGLMGSWEEFMEAVKVVGCDRIVIGTDCGHFAFPAPVEAMRLFITSMLMRGIPDKDVDKMVKGLSWDPPNEGSFGASIPEPRRPGRTTPNVPEPPSIQERACSECSECRKQRGVTLELLLRR